MKKLFLLALTCSLFAVGTANAQTETYYGGQKGSFAITIGADPIIDFVGNMFNGTTDNSLSGIGASLAGKYFLSDKFAVTAGIGFNNNKFKSFKYENPEDEDYEEVTSKDTRGNREFSIDLGGQYYFRSGKRLQPFAGASIFYGRKNSFTSSKDLEAEWEEDGAEIKQYDASYKKSSPTNSFGFMANLGIEYFFVKNISISAALDLGVVTSTNKEVSKYKTDDRDVPNDFIEQQNYSKKNNKTTHFGTGLMNGNIAFNFYF